MKDLQLTPTIILLLFAGRAIAYPCPSGFDPWYDNVCGHAMEQGWASDGTWTDYNYTYANSYCQSLGANLPSSHSLQEDYLLHHSATAAVNQTDAGLGVWLGLQCSGSGYIDNATYSWTDGTPYGYHHFTDPFQCGPNTAYTINMLWTWGVTYPASQVSLLACTIRPSDPNYSSCADFDDVSTTDNTECMKAFPDAKTWTDAEQTCVESGAHLYSIHSDSENDFVKRTAIANGWTGLHIGLQNGDMNPNNAHWTWTDRSYTNTNYTNFVPGFPDPAAGNCTAMQTAFEAGQWSTIDCNSKLPFICHRPVPPQQPSNCPAKTVTYTVGDHIYSPSYPKQVEAGLCDSIAISNSSQKKVAIRVWSFDIYRCCHSLEIRDVDTGTVIATLSGHVEPGTIYRASGTAMRLAWNATTPGRIMGWHLSVFEY